MTDPRDRLARAVGWISRRTGRGGGTTLPGRVLLGLDSGALERLGRDLALGSVLVSATNGKTTTSAMLARILRSDGYGVVSNEAGSNMPWGIATALLGDRSGIGVFEVDEAYLPEVADSLGPRAVVMGNLFRDQLDRYGETEALAAEWVSLASSAPEGTSFVLNADDPMVASVSPPSGPRPLFFGIEDPGVALDDPPHAADARRCRNCGGRLAFDRTYLGHLGVYNCPECGLERPVPDVRATGIELAGTGGLRAFVEWEDQRFRLNLPLPGVYNLYNALAAIAGAVALGVEPGRAVESLESLPPVFGRAERLDIDGTEVSLFLVKNPVGANEVLRSLLSDEGPLDLWLALNDRIADGRDVSWIWDADFEILAESVGAVVCTGTRGAEMALRLKYAGIPQERIAISDDLPGSFDRAVDEAGTHLYALPTYTALLELKEHISHAHGLGRYWEATE